MVIPPEDLTDFLGRIYPFHKKDATLFQSIIPNVKVRQIKGGENVFRAGEVAQTFLLIYQGEIRISQPVDDNSTNPIVLKKGDWFGYEALETGTTYFGNAWAGEGGVVLICFPKQLIESLILEYAWFQQAISLMIASYHLAGRVRLKWLSEGEILYFIARQHPWYLISSLAAPLITGLVMTLVLTGINLLISIDQTLVLFLFSVLLLCICAWLGWNVVDWANDYVIITDRKVVYQRKVVMLYDSRQEVPLNMILAVNVETDQWGRMLGYGNVIVRTYTGMIELPRLKHPQEVAAMVEAQGYRASKQRSEIEKQNIQSILRKRYKMDDGNQEEAKEEVSHYIQPGSIQVLLNNLFRMRFERGDTIVYRTHWSILLARLLLPSLLLLALVTVWLTRAAGIIQLWRIGSFTVIGAMMGAVLAGWWLYQYVDWRNDIYVISGDRIIDINKKPLGKEETKSALIKNIQSIEFNQKWLTALLFNYGTVSIRVGDILFTFDDVYDPSEVQRELANRIAEREYLDYQAELEGQYERMADFMEAYQGLMDERVKQPAGETTEQKSGQDATKLQ